MTEQPLLDLFLRLRDAGLPLGIDEYKELLRALQAGFGLPDEDALRRLCAALWVKDEDDRRLFDLHFDRFAGTRRVIDGEGAGGPDLPTAAPAGGSAPTRALDVDPATSAPAPATGAAAELPRVIDDEVQAAHAVSVALDRDEGLPASAFRFTDDYFPVTKRQMKQSWRTFRQAVRAGPPVDIDIDATVREIGRTGMLLEPVRMARRTNRARLLMLVDEAGSMVPFRGMADRLVETALRGGRLGRSGVFYFHNWPDEFLYEDRHRQRAVPLAEALEPWASDRTGVLVFSDAGAARGRFVPERVTATAAFVDEVRLQISRVAWVNPMPRTRWPGTSAAAIAAGVPMFEFSRRGLYHAILALRGRVNPARPTPGNRT